MAAFTNDLKSRFERAIITSGQNRELYNVAFRNLADEYAGKIKSIGAHIFQVRIDDIAPAFKAAAVPTKRLTAFQSRWISSGWRCAQPDRRNP